MVQNQREQRGVHKGQGDFWQWQASGQCTKGDQCSFRHDRNKRAKVTAQLAPSPEQTTQSEVGKNARSKSPMGKSPSGRISRQPCKEHLQGTCTNPSCENEEFGLRLSGYGVYSTEELIRAETNPTCEIHKAVVRHADIRDQNPSLGCICPCEPHERSPYAPKFEDRSQQETDWQEQGAREAAWQLAKSVFKLKEKYKATFFSPSENRCLPASTLKPEKREFVVASGASMHMFSKKDLSDAEVDTLTKSCSPTIVITANGEVQTHEEATVYVKELDIFLTMKVLDYTPAVLSLGKLCDENRYSYEWINCQKAHLIKNGIRIPCNTENFVPIVVPGLSSSSSGSSSTSNTPSIQEIHCSTSSSSSSSSPTVSDTKTFKINDKNPI